MAKGKKSPRIKPCKPAGVPSKGTGRVRRHRLGTVEKVLFGKGQYVSFRPLGTRELR